MNGIPYALNLSKNISHGLMQEIMLMKLFRSVMIAMQNILWKCKNKIDANRKKQFTFQPIVGNHAN